MLSADNLLMKPGILTIPNAATFGSMGSHDPLAGRAIKFLVVVCLHVVLVAWMLHVRNDAPEELDPIRVSVRLVEAAVPVAPIVIPEPVQALPKPLPQVVRTPAPVKKPVRDVVRKVTPQPLMTASPQQPAAENPISTPITPSVIAVRYDADYLNNPAPVYPILSRRRGEQGKVLLLVQVSAQGIAEQVVIQESSGHQRLDSAALEAVKHWRFVPARRGDEAVAASVVVPILFRLGS